jgi:hypothetical protein
LSLDLLRNSRRMATPLQSPIGQSNLECSLHLQIAATNLDSKIDQPKRASIF